MAGSADDGFTAREAARITGLTVARVRALARQGVLPDVSRGRLMCRESSTVNRNT